MRYEHILSPARTGDNIGIPKPIAEYFQLLAVASNDSN